MKHVDIWTDGASKGNPGPGGYGAVIKYVDKSGIEKRLELKEAFESTTNNKMELLSAIVALEKLKEPCEVTLTSDSKYLVDAFNQDWISEWIDTDFRRGKTTEVKNIDLWERLIDLSKKHKIKFVWVKGHADNVENERCDALANEAIKEKGLA
ncbi:MAG: ribonuclease HI [Lachnospiraceae bacterium]|nr:ribonuclease HI [Lachnospiraceae bacterium]MBR1844368.1 ribonuclease HI [Lachnospiraceae bacterium]